MLYQIDKFEYRAVSNANGRVTNNKLAPADRDYSVHYIIMMIVIHFWFSGNI